MKNGLRLNTVPLPVYFLRLLFLPVGFFSAMFGFVFTLYFLGDEPPTNLGWLTAVIIALALYLLSILPFIVKRPYIIADKTGLHYRVDKIFSNPILQRLNLMYGQHILSEAINNLDYGKTDFDWGEIKRFRLRRQGLMYEVRVVFHDRTGKFVCNSFTRQKAKEAKKSLETLAENNE